MVVLTASGSPLPSEAALTPEGGEIEQLRCRIIELTAAVEARDTFIAIAAHELRNPMTPIIGQIDLLLRSAQEPAGARRSRSSNRMERIQQSMRHYRDARWHSA